MSKVTRFIDWLLETPSQGMQGDYSSYSSDDLQGDSESEDRNEGSNPFAAHFGGAADATDRGESIEEDSFPGFRTDTARAAFRPAHRPPEGGLDAHLPYLNIGRRCTSCKKPLGNRSMWPAAQCQKCLQTQQESRALMEAEAENIPRIKCRYCGKNKLVGIEYPAGTSADPGCFDCGIKRRSRRDNSVAGILGTQEDTDWTDNAGSSTESSSEPVTGEPIISGGAFESGNDHGTGIDWWMPWGEPPDGYGRIKDGRG